MMTQQSFWIFGYGSIIWKTSFPYNNKSFGHVKGYGRRFWQGSHDHRGTREKPGRVVTLIPKSDEMTWGVAYRIDESDWDYVVNNLNLREIDGYSCILTNFYPINSADSCFPVWAYVAHPDNNSFLGDAPIEKIAQQIIESEGESGSNLEYLLKLTESLRQIGPGALDPHTLMLENTVESILRQRKIK